jgi:hypothetical protein
MFSYGNSITRKLESHIQSPSDSQQANLIEILYRAMARSTLDSATVICQPSGLKKKLRWMARAAFPFGMAEASLLRGWQKSKPKHDPQLGQEFLIKRRKLRWRE